MTPASARSGSICSSRITRTATRAIRRASARSRCWATQRLASYSICRRSCGPHSAAANAVTAASPAPSTNSPQASRSAS